MQQRLNHHRVFCLLLAGLVCLFGCDPKTTDTPIESVSYAIEKPYYKGPLRVKVRLSDERVTLSGLLTLELSAEIKSDYQVQFPALPEVLTQFRIHHRDDRPETVSEDGMMIKSYQYRLEPLELGPSEIPALTFHFERKETPEENSAAAGTLTTEPVWIEVITSLPADPNAFAIADIDEVVEMKANYFWLWTALGVAFLLGIGIWIGVLIRPPKTTEIRRVYKSAHAIAFERLKAIAAENLVEQGRIKEFYEKLSTCLRHYIENRFQLRAPEQTTEEFLEQLKTSDALRLEHKQQLQKFLEHSDLVKFARYEPNPEQINESLTMAEEFVEKTKSEEHRVDITQSQQTKGEVL
ncbi:MAG: hypothetical protein ACYSOQ_01180 [Planctomycetota bacterium]|jgi:hypothetical protein